MQVPDFQGLFILGNLAYLLLQEKLEVIKMKRVRLILSVLTLILISNLVLAENACVVRYLEGKAYVQGESSTERELLTINSPIFEGDNIWITEGNMGIVFYDGTIVWLATDSHIEISQFPNPYSENPIGLKMNLWRGMIVLEAKFPVPSESSHIVITPSSSIRTARKSLSIIEIESVDRTRLTVLDGSAIISSGGYSNTVWGNQMSYAEYGHEPSAPVSVGNLSYPEVVEFRQRMTNKPVRTPKSWEYVDPELYSFATDLDYYGYWEDVPGYGHVWFISPAYVYAGWNPYFNGYWRYTHWGCTWISYDPWGWIPFHYGCWTYIGGVGWGWMPDVWFSPAWVSWYWGDGWCGWCPWGYYRGCWGPVWGPCGWYRVDINNIYVTNVTKVAVVNKNGPPPVKPVVPVSKKAFDSDPKLAKKFNPKDTDVLITPTGGLKVAPSRIQDIASKRMTIDDIKRISAEPSSFDRDRKVMPTSLDRDKNIDVSSPSIRGSKTTDIPINPRSGDGVGRGVSKPGDEGNFNPDRTSPSVRTPSKFSDEPSPSVREPSRFSDEPSPNVNPDRNRNDSPKVREPQVTRESPQNYEPREIPQERERPSYRESPKSNDSPRTNDSPRNDYSPPRQDAPRNYSPPPSSPPPQPPPTSNKRSSVTRNSQVQSAHFYTKGNSYKTASSYTASKTSYSGGSYKTSSTKHKF
jgi:hypothetical protein